MALKRIKTGGRPPSIEQKYNSLHTAVLQGIAVFFGSTKFFLFPPYIPITVNFSSQGVSATKWVRFFLVGKGWLLLCNRRFWDRQNTAQNLLCCFKADKHFSFTQIGQAILLKQWQTFIGKYP